MALHTTTLSLAKQNFKFSSAHFLIFDDKHAEMLHGHNYRVEVELGLPPEEKYQNQGYFIDFNLFKKFIKAACDEWDEHILLPRLHPDLKTNIKGDSLEVNFRDRFYVFPKKEVCLLEVTNTSVEQLSKILSTKIYQEFQNSGITFVSVYVEETAGQGATTTCRSPQG